MWLPRTGGSFTSAAARFGVNDRPSGTARRSANVRGARVMMHRWEESSRRGGRLMRGAAGERHVQFAYQNAKKVVAKNFAPADVDEPLDELLTFGFAAVHISTRTEEIDIRTSRKGKVHVGSHKMGEPRTAEVEPHNRVKDV